MLYTHKRREITCRRAALRAEMKRSRLTQSVRFSASRRASQLIINIANANNILARSPASTIAISYLSRIAEYIQNVVISTRLHTRLLPPMGAPMPSQFLLIGAALIFTFLRFIGAVTACSRGIRDDCYFI